MFDKDFEKYVKNTLITDPFTIAAMWGAWEGRWIVLSKAAAEHNKTRSTSNE